MGHDLLQVIRINGVHDVEEVLSGWPFFIGKLVREVYHEWFILLKIWKDLFDRQLVVAGHMDVVDLHLLEQRLLIRKYCLEEVLVDLVRGWKIILD